jgi:hypothetical protein
MSFDRRWLENFGSNDSHGRVIWALGTCVGRCRDAGLQSWAAHLFDRALPAVAQVDSPRTWAFALLGLSEYRRRFRGDRQAADMRQHLASRLTRLHENQSSKKWHWYEPVLTYANAKIPHAMIIAGTDLHDDATRDLGLTTLRWLIEQQIDERGRFSPIGTEGFYRRGSERASFDQQPIDAEATVSACLAAYDVTDDEFFLVEAMRAFRWFVGANKLGVALYDAATGGCRDGLHVDRPNENQGAESTLAFLLSLVGMKTHEQALSSIRRDAGEVLPLLPRISKDLAVPEPHPKHPV